MFAIRFIDKFYNLTDYVSGFSKTHGIVQTCSPDNPEYIKTWKTMRGAQSFMDKYSDCGYGMSSEKVKIVTI